ncbi:NAD(P)/FAD-dependent oxidoreductase [Bacteriovorax sp. PP10]|uniref:NAD(P)/FAD-dependent oxidoreductase n=1 Tax=Bacteriovorax antarcticus TaxID=3088717 RepID=A0ABU5VX13_9BACT|nr:NAD(P)/FAD-dependent oxidoreductase [Bacteriovorax sp. PP10]MEA9356888.1 NAD(P)/FAD-dependent oxidoreductase [Bacteriovorax sp. PP10]
MEYDYIVIGAGSAGLSFAALMEKKGHSVAVLEAHSIPGGCSSYFERDGFIFDAGATTLSGLKKGRPLYNLIQQLDLKLELTNIDPGIVSILPSQTVNRFKNFDQWMEELKTKFPDIDHRTLWTKFLKIENQGWNLSTTFKNIPLRSFKKISSFFNFKTLGAVGTLPALLKSVDQELISQKITDPEYLSMIDEMLFITAQNNRQDTPLLMGSMGLGYPDDTFYATGGMKAFAHAIASNCSNIFYRNKVQKIVPVVSGFEVVTNKGVYKSKKLISTIPLWNHVDLFEDQKIKDFYLNYPALNPDECWSAFMIYLTIPTDRNRSSLYYQIHTDVIPHCDTRSFFVSLSHPDDKVRSINGRQVVTISTHTRANVWLGLEIDDYKKKKAESAEYILNILKDKFQLQDNDLQNIVTGSPKSFIKYTNRYNGLVGGIPHSLKRNPMDFLIAKSPIENFYMLGDTQFPGQGIAAVVLGAQNLTEYLTN